MHPFFSNLLLDIEEQLRFISSEHSVVQTRAEESYLITLKAYQKLQLFVVKHKFKTPGEEINYFKVLKPKITSKLIYFSKVYHIENNKPQGSVKCKRKYYFNELNKINRYFDENIDFIRYYRSNECCMDHIYFLRNKIDFRRVSETFSLELDKTQGTNFDFKLSKIIANDLLQIYLHQELQQLQFDSPTPIPTANYSWTGSKTALTELIYALHSNGVIENGTADIKEISLFFEQIFNIQLGDYYRTFLELKMRKTARTKFLDSLRDSLINRMDKQDEKP